MNTNKTENSLEKTLNSRVIPVIFLITILALPDLGFCDAADMEAVSLSFLKTATASWLKRIFCTFFGLFGIFRTAATSTAAPIIMFGGIAFCIGFIDKLINFFATLTL